MSEKLLAESCERGPALADAENYLRSLRALERARLTKGAMMAAGLPPLMMVIADDRIAAVFSPAIR